MERRAANGFLISALAEVPRLLGQLNRNPASRTYGSFDRAYWHYRTNDISSARYQEAAYTLSLLYACDFDGNLYYRDEKMLEWIRASLRFTASLQQGDGSFDEWYVNEGSYVATAFVAAALSQVVMLFREEDIRIPEERLALRLLERAAQFLRAHEEKTVMNQVSGAIFAMAAAGRLTGRKDLARGADTLLDAFLGKQSREGWWSEYGGPDTGYLSLTVSYLEKYARLPGTKPVAQAIEKAVHFLTQFVHPDGTVGGEYMSRNTEYMIPADALPYLLALRPEHFDDRYLCYILYNWIETGLRTPPREFAVATGEQYYPESGLLRVAGHNSLLVANGMKGGSFRLYAGGRVYYDSGVDIIAPTGRYTTGSLNPRDRVGFKKGNFSASGVVTLINEPLMTTPVAILFKAWQVTLGRLSLSRALVKKLLRLRMISYAGGGRSSFERAISYGPESITVTDRIKGPLAEHAVHVGSKAAYTAVPSSKYAAIPELASRTIVPETEEKKSAGEYIIRRRFSF